MRKGKEKLTEDETELLTMYRLCDTRGKSLVFQLANMWLSEYSDKQYEQEYVCVLQMVPK